MAHRSAARLRVLCGTLLLSVLAVTWITPSCSAQYLGENRASAPTPYNFNFPSPKPNSATTPGGEQVMAELESLQTPDFSGTGPPDRDAQFAMQQKLLQGYGYTAAQEAIHYREAIQERQQYIASAKKWIADTEVKVKNIISEVQATTQEKIKEEEEKIRLAQETVKNLEAVDRETRKKFLANKKKLQEMASTDRFPYMNEYATQAQYTQMFGNAARSLLEHVYYNLRSQRNFIAETQQRIREAHERLSDWQQDLSDSTKIEIQNEQARIQQSENELKRLQKLLGEAETNIRRYDQELQRVSYEYDHEKKYEALREATHFTRLMEKELKARQSRQRDLQSQVQNISKKLNQVNNNLKQLRVVSYGGGGNNQQQGGGGGGNNQQQRGGNNNQQQGGNNQQQQGGNNNQQQSPGGNQQQGGGAPNQNAPQGGNAPAPVS